MRQRDTLPSAAPQRPESFSDVGKNRPISVTAREREGVRTDTDFYAHFDRLVHRRTKALDAFRARRFEGVHPWLGQRRRNALGVPRLYFKVGTSSVRKLDQRVLRRHGVDASSQMLLDLRELTEIDRMIEHMTAVALWAQQEALRVCEACAEWLRRGVYPLEDIEILESAVRAAAVMPAGGERPHPFEARRAAYSAVCAASAALKKRADRYLQSEVARDKRYLPRALLVLYIDGRFIQNMPPMCVWRFMVRGERGRGGYMPRGATTCMRGSEPQILVVPKRLTRTFLRLLGMRKHSPFYLQFDKQVAQLLKIREGARALFDLPQWHWSVRVRPVRAKCGTVGRANRGGEITQPSKKRGRNRLISLAQEAEKCGTEGRANTAPQEREAKPCTPTRTNHH